MKTHFHQKMKMSRLPTFHPFTPSLRMAAHVVMAAMWAVCLMPLSAETTDGSFKEIRAKYTRWVAGSDGADAPANPYTGSRRKEIVKQCAAALHQVERYDFSQNGQKLYYTAKAGEDSREIHRFITEWLPALAIGYATPGNADVSNPHYGNPKVADAAMRLFDRLHQRGFCEPMSMPWKSSKAGTPDPGRAVVVDFHLRVSGYALAVFLFRDELEKSGRLSRCLDTCREVLRHDEKYGNPGAPKLNADGIRIAMNFALPYALAAGDRARLDLIRRQTERSMAIETDASDTIKPDGLGFHHRAAYLSGYSSFAISQAAFSAWLFAETEWAINAETLGNLTRFMETLRFVSQKYDMHKSLAGRLGNIAVVNQVLLGYAYLADIEHDGRVLCRAMLARLADDTFMASPEARLIFNGFRDEVPPGPATIAWFYNVRATSIQEGAETAPVGNRAFNYGPLMVHRRGEWMASVKGFSKYLWAFERSLTDDRNDERRENVLGYHDSSASLYLYAKGDPVNAADSGYFHPGWDWSHIPGTTTHYLTGRELLALDTDSRYNRPFSDSAFAGGVSDGRNGLFSMEYREERPGAGQPRLQALKSVFFFDDLILCLSTGIRGGDGKSPVHTTLYQCALTESQSTWVNEKEVRENHRPDRIGGQSDNQVLGLRLMDPAGNGYWLPPGNAATLFRGRQHSVDWKGLSDREGDYATAWIDHGRQPEDNRCEYAILVNTTPEALRSFAESQRTKPRYQILVATNSQQIVRFPAYHTIAYALARPMEQGRHGPVWSTSKPLLVLARESVDNGKLSLHLCDPDLGWEPTVHYQINKEERSGYDPPLPEVKSSFEIVVKGKWKLATPQHEVSIRSTDSGHTTIKCATANARGIELNLVSDH